MVPDQERNHGSPFTHDTPWAWLQRIPGAIRRRRNPMITERIETFHETIAERESELRTEWDYSDEDAQLMVNPDRSDVLPAPESVYRT